jgi:uncharacterized membrane protein YfcA
VTDSPARPTSAGYWLTLVLIGALGGTLSGAFGVGGGILMVPMLLTFARMNQREAASTSLIAIVPAAITGSIIYVVQGEVDFVAAGIVAIGGIAGVLLGTRLLRRLPLGVLRWLFIVLLLLVAVRLLLVVPERGETLALSPLVIAGMIALGLVMGIASGLFGIGGGVVVVPVLIGVFGVSDLLAKGTSLLVMIPTGIFGSVMNLRGRLVSIRPGLVVGAAASAASFGGAALAFLFPPALSNYLFAGLVLIAAVQLSIKALRDRPPAAPPAP